MKKILVLIFLIPCIAYSQFPKDIIWQSCSGTSEPEKVYDLLETQNAYYILSGTEDIINSNSGDDILLTKINKEGELVWQKVYGGSSNEYPVTIIKDFYGRIYIGASTYSDDGDIQSGNKGGTDAWIIKLDTSGTILWERTYGGSKSDYSGNLIYLENGNILLYTASFSSDYDVEMNYGFLDLWLLELTPNGDIINSKSYGSSNHDNIFSLIQTSDGGFFTAAKAGTNDGVVNGEPRGGSDVWLIKMDEQLNIEWQKLIGGSFLDGGGYGLTELPDGGYIFNGKTRSSDKDVHGFDFPEVPDQDDNWVVRLDSVGNIVWDIALGGDRFESSSEVFANNDGTFTVFGSTKSMNNGDVEGHHYHQLDPSFPNYDIWMVKLNEFGEIIDQRCFGNTGNDKIYRGVIKKSDFHYLLAGTAWSLPDDTIGDVNGGYESDSYDIWFFEIVDCEYFQPATPIGIEGESIICTDQSIQTTYSTQIVNLKYEEAQWQILPVEAGELIQYHDSVVVQWNTAFEGQVELRVKSINKCGESEYSEPKIIELALHPEIPTPIMGIDSVCTINTTQTIYTTQLSEPENEEANWQLLPPEAGELTNLQDTVIIQWYTDFEGQVSLSVKSTNACGESEYTEPKIIEVRSCVGIKEIQQKELKTYPNPASSQITFELPIIIKESIIYIKDIYGKSIAQILLAKAQSKTQWDCSAVSQGVYFYQTEINGEVYRGKIVVN